MDFLSERGFPQLALEVGDLFIPTGLIKDEHTDVLASRIRAMGYLGHSEEANALVVKVWSLCIRDAVITFANVIVTNQLLTCRLLFCNDELQHPFSSVYTISIVYQISIILMFKTFECRE